VMALAGNLTPARKRVIVTTSWDDGHPQDVRLAETLARYGVRGTFYVPIDHAAGPRMEWDQVRKLRDMGMEIGADALTRPRMSNISERDAMRELSAGKEVLERVLARPVTSFAFPEGKLTRRLTPLLRALGYHSARTNVSFRTEMEFDPFAMPVTFQLWPHTRREIVRHALGDGNLRGLAAWARWGAETDLTRLAETILNDLERTGGVLHIWGHSWEIARAGLWPVLDQVLEGVSRRAGVEYLTNHELLSRALGRGFRALSNYA
jgi:peptidoglycan/xylan/chitin deacetylase (PgdA/CDA1 family)